MVWEQVFIEINRQRMHTKYTQEKFTNINNQLEVRYR
jgi:hypothetical protein